MCYGHGQSEDEPRRASNGIGPEPIGVLRVRLAETHARLARARAREAELRRRLEEMKRFYSVMDIMEGFLRRRFREQQEDVLRLLSAIPGTGSRR